MEILETVREGENIGNYKKEDKEMDKTLTKEAVPVGKYSWGNGENKGRGKIIISCWVI